MNYGELIEFYNEPVLIGRPDADKYLIMAAQIMAEEENNMLLRRHKPKTNNYSEFLELYMTPVKARRDKEELTNEVKEEKMNCALCGKDLDIYECPEEGRPLVDGKICKQCKVKARNYEDAIKASYPDSLQYFVKGRELEDE